MKSIIRLKVRCEGWVQAAWLAASVSGDTRWLVPGPRAVHCLEKALFYWRD